MKHKILLAILLGCGVAIQANAEDGKDDIAAQYIVTDCGTVYKIPKSATAEEAADLIDKFSKMDCSGH